MRIENLPELLGNIRKARVAVLGDYCLDVYWFVDMSRSEISLETGILTHPVSRQRYSLGGAGNVVSNLAALGVGSVYALGVTGDDPWGRELQRLLHAVNADTSGILTQRDDWATLAYIKPHLEGSEVNRRDFGNFNELSRETAEALIARLESLMGVVDVVVVNQQVLQGIHTPALRALLAGSIERHPGVIFIADSRHFSECYPGACLKLNGHEAARLIGVERGREDLVTRDEVLNAAGSLFERSGRPVFVTRGSRGVVVRASEGVAEIPGIQVLGKLDPVGAGDSMLAGIAAALAVGASPREAAALGNFAATVTIQKIHETGTASPDEILEVGLDPDYVYRPELAEDPRQARRLPGTEFEVIAPIPADLRITHAIFDHDGTISALRQGWEELMEPMMVRAILGPQFEDAGESLYHRVVVRVREYIDRSTGIQTLVQMQGLVDLVREFGCVVATEIKSAQEYKQIFNTALVSRVSERLAKLRRGELSVEDLTIKNAPLFLSKLRKAGVKLFLASGTDRDDVLAEAEALGYASYFEGRIYGAVGDVAKEAKRIVLDRVLADIGDGAMRGLVTFGDGPVEIRETAKRGGQAVGLASDEVRRYGLNYAKRERLIRAGAGVIIPDFSQVSELLSVLQIV